MRMTVEPLVECELAGETEVLGKNLPQRHFVHHKSHTTRPWLEPLAAAVGSQRLTAWAMARPIYLDKPYSLANTLPSCTISYHSGHKAMKSAYCLLEFDAVYSGRSSPTFRSMSVSIFKVEEWAKQKVKR
jgi:hypothetical protein